MRSFDKIVGQTSDRTSKYPQQIRSIVLFNQNNPHQNPGQLSKLNKNSEPNLRQHPANSLTATLVQ